MYTVVFVDGQPPQIKEEDLWRASRSARRTIITSETQTIKNFN